MSDKPKPAKIERSKPREMSLLERRVRSYHRKNLSGQDYLVAFYKYDLPHLARYVPPLVLGLTKFGSVYGWIAYHPFTKPLLDVRKTHPLVLNQGMVYLWWDGRDLEGITLEVAVERVDSMRNQMYYRETAIKDLGDVLSEWSDEDQDILARLEAAPAEELPPLEAYEDDHDTSQP